MTPKMSDFQKFIYMKRISFSSHLLMVKKFQEQTFILSWNHLIKWIKACNFSSLYCCVLSKNKQNGWLIIALTTLGVYIHIYPKCTISQRNSSFTCPLSGDFIPLRFSTHWRNCICWFIRQSGKGRMFIQPSPDVWVVRHFGLSVARRSQRNDIEDTRS